MKKDVFQRLENIVKDLTPERLKAAEEELKSSQFVTDPDIDLLLRELQHYGKAHPLSNESRINARLKIKSMC
jgi:hypothetical protein